MGYLLLCLIKYSIHLHSKSTSSTYFIWVISHSLQVSLDLLDNFLISGLAIWGLGGIHLILAANHLSDSQSKSKKSVLPGLSFLRDTSLETTRGGVDHKNATIGLKKVTEQNIYKKALNIHFKVV